MLFRSTPALGTMFMVIFLFLIGEINDRIAVLFAWLIVLGSFAVNGAEALALMTSLTSGGSKAGATTAQPLAWDWSFLNPANAVSNAVSQFWNSPHNVPLGTVTIGGSSSMPSTVKNAGQRGSGWAQTHPPTKKGTS